MDNITLELEPGRIYALLGPNGSGKTTFMKTVAGLVKPTEGTVLYKGQPIGVASKKEVSYMPTEDYFYPYKSDNHNNRNRLLLPLLHACRQ